MSTSALQISRWPSWLRLPRSKFIALAAGLSVLALGYLLNSEWKKRKTRRASGGADEEKNDVVQELRRGDANFRSESGSSRQRFNSERPSTRISLRGSSTTIPSHECQLLSGCDTFQGIVQTLETALAGFDLLKNRSDRDKSRADMLASVITRLRIIETDINRLVTEGGYDRGDLPATDAIATAMWNGFSSRRTGSLSLLSEDSFHSCFDDFSSCLDDPSVRETLTFDRSSLAFYQEGLEEAANGNVDFRKSRAEFCGCDSDVDFAAKLWCLRRAFANIVADEHRRLWLTNAGRQIMADLLRHDGRETREFYSAYDDIIEFVNNEVNHEKMWEELSARKVADLGMWDVLLDFVLLDAFDDITHPPATIIALLSNKFLTRKMKESSLSTVLWTTISAKRRRLLYADGFINHFYNLTLIMTPSLALAFFGGSSDAYRELCQFFKEQVCSFVVEIFNLQNIRYTSLEELTEDLHSSLASRIETLQTRLSNELLPT